MDLPGRLKKGASLCGSLRAWFLLVVVFSPALWGQPEGFFGGYVAFPYRGNSPFNYSAALGAASNPFSLRLLNQTLPTTSCIAFSGAANCFPGSQAAANALFGAQQNAAVQRADAVIASVFGGANPFLGQRIPSQEFANFGSSNLVRSGFGGWAADPTLQTVLGFSSGSNVNIGTAFLQNFNSTFSPFGGGGFGRFGVRVKEPLISAAPPVASLDDLNRRWQALAGREIDYYYSDANLSPLRAESDTLSIVGSYGEPMYMYWTSGLNSVAGQVQARTPSYSQWEAASQDVSSWTNPPDSVDSLAQRFARRQQVQELAARVQIEGLQIIHADTVLANNILQVTQLLPQLLQQAASNDLLRANLSAWQTRWNAAYSSTETYRSMLAERDRIFRDYPGLEEYLQLTSEISGMLPAFKDLPQVQSASANAAAVLASPDVTGRINSLYAQYVAGVNQVLAQTAYSAEIERYYERLNGLLVNDPTYNVLATTQYVAVLALQVQQQAVHDAVANCFARRGSACDPYIDPMVTAAVANPDSARLAQLAGQFFEEHRKFWYRFSRSSQYTNLVNQARQRVEASLMPVQLAIDSLRQQYERDVSAIPQIQDLRNNQLQLAGVLRGQFPELDWRMSRLTYLLSTSLGADATGPDLLVTSFTAGTRVVAGGSLSAQAVVRNRGSTAAGSFRIAFYYSQDANVTISDPFSNSACEARGLAAGDTFTCNGPINVPSDIAGAYYAGVYIDDTNQAAELNESNNTAVATAGVEVTPSAGTVVPIFAASGIINAASGVAGAVAPGEVVTIFGSNVGPSQPAGPALGADRRVAQEIGGTRVLFDNVAAPMIYAGAGQVSAVVPYSMAGKSTIQIRVVRGNIQSAAVSAPVVLAVPGLFTQNSSGSGQTAAVNQDGTLNGPGNPARKGSLVVLYATGEGRVLPDAEDGSITTSPRSPRLPVSVFIDGRPAQIVFAGSAPGIVAGVVQVNVYVPMEGRSGSVPVQLRIGDAVSQGNVTLALTP